jgi:hypothetical protein
MEPTQFETFAPRVNTNSQRLRNNIPFICHLVESWSHNIHTGEGSKMGDKYHAGAAANLFHATMTERLSNLPLRVKIIETV